MSAAYGQANASTDASDYNATKFIVDAALAKMQTVTIAKVVAVHGGGVAPVGTVDIQVLVNIMSGNRTAIPHAVIYGVPFVRIQGGPNAFICDPVAGDIGLIHFASRDISVVKATKGAANPGSRRSFDWADAIYVGGMLNATPTQYLQMSSGGVLLLSPTSIKLQSPTLEVTGTATFDASVDIEGNLNVDGVITGTSAVFSGSVTASSFIGGGGGGGSVTSVGLGSTTLTIGGTNPVTGSGTITVNLPATGPGVGSYTNANITIDAYGRITAASNGTAAPTGANPTASVGPTAVNGSAATFMRSDAAPALANTTVTPGAYTSANITVDAQGRLTAASNGGGGGGGALAPAAIAGLQVWFESDLVALPPGGSSPGLFYLPSRDPSRMPAYATAQTGGVPVAAAALNGLPVMAFDGTTQNNAYNMLQQAMAYNKSTVFAVYKPTDYTTNAASLTSGAIHSLNHVVAITGNLQIIECYTAILAASVNPIPNTAWSQFNMSFDYSTGAYAFRIASTADSSGTGTTGSFGAPFTTIGGNQQSINIATGYPNTQYAYGSLAALIIYNRVLTLAEKQSVEAYLLAKWGV